MPASDVVEIARRVGAETLGPRAQEADRAPGPLVENYRALAVAGLLGLTVPRAYGGLEADPLTLWRCTIELSSFCGVTAFTQAQHQSACRILAGAPDAALKQRLLPDLAAGRTLCAIAFAHLRRPGDPMLRAHPVPGGYRLNGTAPWVTGWGLMNQAVLAGTLPDGGFVYLWTPFEDHGRGTLTATPPLSLCAMNASATVQLRCEDWFVPEAHRLAVSNREALRQADRRNVLTHTALPLGCARGSLRLLQDTVESRRLRSLKSQVQSLATELDDLTEQIAFWYGQESAPDFFDHALPLRAWCIELGMRLAHAAVAASSGSANTLDHPAQRLVREAMFYVVQAQTPDVMEATISRLVR